MGFLKRIRKWTQSWGTNFEPVRRPSIEKLEPRILLSGDGLLSVTPDPLQDSLLDNTLQVIEYFELVDTSNTTEQESSANVVIERTELVPQDSSDIESSPSSNSTALPLPEPV